MTQTTGWEIPARVADVLLFKGRLPFLDDATLAALLDESQRWRADGIQVEKQAHSSAGPVATRFAHSPEMLAFIADRAEPARPTGNSNYLYYDTPGACIEPHIDSADFPLQVLMMLRHDGYGDERSALALFPDGPKNPVRVELDAGECVLFRASSVYHGRTPIGESEHAVLLGMGYARR